MKFTLLAKVNVLFLLLTLSDVFKRRGLAPIGEPLILIQQADFRDTYSYSCMTALDMDQPLFLTGRTNSNDQVDFIKFLVLAVEAGYLKQGDILVCDNARIHGGSATVEILEALRQLTGFQLVYLPAYSPEFNPCELVFMKVKRYLREYRTSSIPLWVDIVAAFATVSQHNVVSFYNKCCYS